MLAHPRPLSMNVTRGKGPERRVKASPSSFGQEAVMSEALPTGAHPAELRAVEAAPRVQFDHHHDVAFRWARIEAPGNVDIDDRPGSDTADGELCRTLTGHTDSP